ncbi:uncharacterized protein LOC134529148 [Bacillus rossius redtenbacheri]|uniref:uncharacterized protein LOC134529148 n=1 Tax=Bacillus rossius redtenbacheri TaxID=93214 RepID=UPI002FDD39D7
MDSLLAERAQQLFLLADKERKGFIVKRDMQMMKMCEDLENQMKEKEKLSSKGEERTTDACRRMSQELQRRDKLLLELQDDHRQMAARIHELSAAVAALKLENAQLAATKLQLERELRGSCDEAARLRRCAELDRAEAAWERRRCVSAGFQLARSLLTEQQGLMRQLQLLQSISATLEADEGQPAEVGYFDTQPCLHCAGVADDVACLDYEYDEDFHKRGSRADGFERAKDSSLAGEDTAAPCLQEELQSCCPDKAANLPEGTC